MSFYGILMLTGFIFIRFIPEIITLVFLYDTEYIDRSKHVKSSALLSFAIISSVLNFLVYILFHYRSFHSWNLAETILNIVKGNIFYEDFSYFSESLLLCAIAAIAIGMGLRLLLKKIFFGREYGHNGFSVWNRVVVLLAVSVTVVASIVCYSVKSSGASKLVINEICSKNVSVFLGKDEVIDDYVELYNSGWLPYSVSGMYLSDDEDHLEKYEIPFDVLKPGEYQVIILDENAPFHISDTGETIYLSRGGQILEQIDCVALNKDCSYCRITDGGSDWGIRTCTPGKDNEISNPVLSPPVFSHKGGFYTEEFDLQMFCKEGETIYYTLDGSVPSTDSELYGEAIRIRDVSENKNVWSMREDVSAGFLDKASTGYEVPNYQLDKCVVLRAVSVDEEGNRSPVASATYFVGFDQKEGYRGMNILSILTEPDNLFDYDKGIYVMGSIYDSSKEYDSTQWYSDLWWWWNANYKQSGREWEREACLQFFGTERDLLLSKDAGIRLQGNGSRGQLPKSFNFYARDEYDGDNRFRADLFGSGYEPQRVTLFAGGDDRQLKVKDYLIMELGTDRAFATMDFMPYVMFLDGEYWGCYWLTEKYDEEYFAYHYYVDSNNIVMIKDDEQGNLAIGNEDDEALYDTMYAFISNTDLSSDENYRKACELIDIDSYIDYYAAEIYIANPDWPHNNYGLWRTRTVEEDTYSDGKWRWVLFDVNREGAMASRKIEMDSFGEVMENDPMFSSLMKNKEFSGKFVSTILDMANKEFRPENVNRILDGYKELMKVPLAKEYERFYGRNENEASGFEEDVQDIRDFFEGRYHYITNYFENQRDNGE